MRPFKRTTLIYFVIFWFMYIVTVPCSGSKVIQTSAKSLAEKAGAAQYAVHIEEEITPNGRHDLRKRVTDDNLFDGDDYEIYQGVVGRPGIDFPVLTGIPQTGFNCRNVGNGYFADLETECQVFHICESGKKISFLCPNGTIFQQTELICDWWFKVNCAAAPGHYAESSEVLSRARAKDSTNKTTAAAGGAASTTADRKNEKRNKPKENPLKDGFDFEDFSVPLSGPKSNALNDRRGKAEASKFASHEMQELAESQSIARAAQQNGNNFAGYQYKQPGQNEKKINPTTQPAPSRASTATVNPTSGKVRDNDFQGYYYKEPDRGSRRIQTTKPPSSLEPLRYTQGTASTTTTTTTTAAPVTFPHRGTTKYKDSIKPNQDQFLINVADVPNRLDKQATTTTTVPTTQFVPSTSPPLIRNRGNNLASKTTRFEPTRTTPYYTPTIPSIATTRPTISSRFSETRPTVSSAKEAEHAMEMMQTIHDLKLDSQMDSQMNSGDGGKDYGSRSGLVIPPSSGPETLHSLALYFATAVDSLVTKPVDSTTPQSVGLPGLKGLDVQVGNVTKIDSSLISDSTKREYQSLFGTDEIYKQIQKTTEKAANLQKESSTTSAQPNDDFNYLNINNDLETEFSNNPIIAAAGTKQIRELAQVFTHALSAYLHDPSTFRRVLAEIRPTEPPVTQNYDYLNNRVGRNKEFKDGTGATYLPTPATQKSKDDIPTTEDFEVLDFSDVTASTLESNDQTTTSNQQNETGTTSASLAAETFDTTHSQILHDSLKHIDHVPASRILTEALETFAINQYTGNALLDGTTEASNPLAIEINDGLEATTNYPYLEDFENGNNQKVNLTSGPSTEYPNYNVGSTMPPSLISFELLPPSDVNKGIDGIPPPADENDLQRAQSQYGGKGKNKFDGQRTGKEFGEKTNPRSLKTENGHFITEITPTITPPTDLSRTTVPENGKVNPNTWSTLSYSVFLDPLTINDGLMSSNEESTVTPSQHTYLPNQSTQTPSYSDSTAPTVNEINRQGKAQTFATTTQAPIPSHEDYMEVMQRKANEMFGGLNDTQASHLMNVMKKADNNKTVRRLILLLIQTCDDDYNTTVEQSRQALLNALIRMDSKFEDENELQIIKTNRRGEKSIDFLNQRQQLNQASTTTQLPITTYHRPLSIHYDQTQSTHMPQTGYYQTETTTNYPTFQTTDYYQGSTISPNNFDYSTVQTTYPPSENYVDTTTTTYYQPPTTTTYAPIPSSSIVTTIAPTTRSPTTIRPSSRRKPTTQPPITSGRNSKRLAKDLDQYLANQGDNNQLNANQSHRNSDARALELLRSLYSLAGRFVAQSLPNFSRGRSGL